MVKFHTIGQWEKQYHFEDAVASVDTFNGAFGDIVDGKFVPGANGSKAIMNEEVGDYAGQPTYPIKKDEHVRVVKLDEMNGQLIEVYGDEVPTEVAVDDKLASDETGALVTGASAVPYVQVVKVIGNKLGVLAKVVAE